jgi:hypothetical protein
MEMKRNENMPTNRSFGIVFSIVFFLLGIFPLALNESVYFVPLFTSVSLLFLTFTLPRILTPFNYIWFRFGMLLHAIVSPIALGILFYGVVTPTGLLMRLFGKKPLALDFDRDAPSYWIQRSPPGPTPESMTNQF